MRHAAPAEVDEIALGGGVVGVDSAGVEAVVQLRVLKVPNCPGAELLVRRLAEVLGRGRYRTVYGSLVILEARPTTSP